MPHKDADKSSSQTNEPWKKPGQTSVDPSIQPLHKEDVIEQKKNQKQDR